MGKAQEKGVGYMINNIKRILEKKIDDAVNQGVTEKRNKFDDAANQAVSKKSKIFVSGTPKVGLGIEAVARITGLHEEQIKKIMEEN